MTDDTEVRDGLMKELAAFFSAKEQEDVELNPEEQADIEQIRARFKGYREAGQFRDIGR